jgi:hypothetical protein
MELEYYSYFDEKVITIGGKQISQIFLFDFFDIIVPVKSTCKQVSLKEHFYEPALVY